MTLAAALVLATVATIAVSAALLACTRNANRAAARSWVVDLAHAIALGGLRCLPREHLDRYREECEADLHELRDDPRAALVHALHTAAGAQRLTRLLDATAPRRRPPLHRRALAHLGVPVRLDAAEADADSSYVFGGAMRVRR